MASVIINNYRKKIYFMYTIGDMIKTFRSELLVSQEELSDGLCTAVTLSRIENNQQIPSIATFEALMQRLGQPYDAYPAIMDEDDERIYHQRYEIRNCIINQEYIKTRELLDELIKEENLDYLYEQFILYAENILIEKLNKDHEAALTGYQKALDITLKNFKIENISKRLLTEEEINLITSIAECNFMLGNKEEAIVIAYALEEFFTNRIILMRYNVDIYMLILKHLSGWLNDEGRYEEAVLISNKGIDCCKKFSKLKAFPYFVFHKGYGLHNRNEISEAKKCILNAYHMFQAIMNDEGVLMVKEYIELRMHEIITKDDLDE